MIKSIQLLKESFTTYTFNFNNILSVTWPVIAILAVISVVDQMVQGGPLKLLSILVSIVLTVAISLFFQPVLYRSIQKLEDTNAFNKDAAYEFQKRNIWNYIKLNFWMIVYALKINLMYILIIAVAIIAFVTSSAALPPAITPIVGILVGIVVAVTIIASIIKNSPRIFLYQNIFFSKEITPRNAVLESLALGESKNRQVWKIILSSILVGLIALVLYGIIYGIVVLTGIVSFNDLLQMSDTESGVKPNSLFLVLQFIGGILSYAVVTPITFIILAKGYSKIKEPVATPVENTV